MHRNVVCAVCGLIVVVVCWLASSPAGGAEAAKPAATHQVKGLNITLLRIDAGEFLMGSPADEAGRQAHEQLHTVKLTKPFFIGKTEVSQWQYEELMGENPSINKGGELPVENVTWSEAVAFCQQLSRRTGQRFRLPTEAEWEYAARAGSTGPVAAGGRLDEVTWYANNSGKEKLDAADLWKRNPSGYFATLQANDCRPRSVTEGKPNAWGLLNMQGNVSEWVEDFFDPNYYTTDAAKTDPTGPARSDRKSRVFRGGNFGSDADHCRLAHREWNRPGVIAGSRGFRIVMETDE